ncbi:STAS domain-containing protein [Candidatus Sumerlaeota bacterium]|nr:STAS domain-containing protein [Candidatus Sumerlaeota bacterium]
MDERTKPFSVEVKASEKEPGIDIVTMSGYLDAHTVVDFEREIEKRLDRGGNRVVIDARELNYISSAGIGALMKIDQQVRKSDGRMILIQPAPNVLSVLEMLGFTQIFHFAQTLDEALEFLQAPSS